MKLKSLRVLLWSCPFSLPAVEEDEEEEEVVEVEEEEEEEECWGPCWLSDSASCRRSNSAKSVGVVGKADQTSVKTGGLPFFFFSCRLIMQRSLFIFFRSVGYQFLFSKLFKSLLK